MPNPQGYATGHVRRPDKDHLIEVSAAKWGDWLKYVKKALGNLPATWDSWTKGWVGPIKDQGQCGSCFPAGTLIRMADGSHKPIEQVTSLDRVLTAEGNIHRVTHTMRRQAEEPLLTLETWGHYHLRATAEHPILTRRGYVKLGDVQPGDWVAFPRYAPQTTKVIQTAFYASSRLLTRRKQYIGGHRLARTSINVLPDIIHLTPGFGRLVGLYLAEGSSDRARVRFSFNIEEKDTLAAEVAALAKSELDMEATIDELPESNGARVTIYGTRLARLFDALLGRGAGGKILHADLTSGPLDFLRGVLTGWMDGDKHRDGSAVSISRRLALSMFDIANALGMMPALATHQRERVDKNGMTHRHAWRVEVNDPETYKRGATVQDERNMWRKVREVTAEGYRGDVFNLEVEADHSYVAEGVGVHNCWDFSGTRVCEVAFYKAGILKADGSQALSEEYTLSCGRNGGCNGDDNTTVLDWAKTTGLPLTSDYGSYTASAGTCNWKAGMRLMQITSWLFADSNGGKGVTPPEDIKSQIMDKGCVGCAVDAGFDNPGTGVITGGGNNIDHDVTLTGWNDTSTKTTATANPSMPASVIASNGWWWMDNSWGTSWGDKGRARIQWGAYSIGTEAVAAAVPGSSTINWIP